MKIESMIQKTSIFFRYSAILYLFVGAFYFINLPVGGDEFLFLSDLQLIKNDGWYTAIIQNVSIPYMLLTYPFSFILQDEVALRLVNIILLLILFLYFYYVGQVKFKSTYSYLFFFISTVGYFYFGTNDCLFFVSLIIFFNEVNNAVHKKNVLFDLALSTLVIAFFTRELFLVYLPIIIIGLYLLYNSGCRFSKKTLYPLAIFVFFLMLNIPSIEKNGTLSFDRKNPPEGINVSWSQRQYLAQLMVNKGELSNGQHPSWELTEQYLDKNGNESLPNGILNGITFDFQLTIKEFFKDFAYSMTYSFRALGLMLLLTLFYWFSKMIKEKSIELNNFIPFATLTMLLIFSFIIISYVELRWLSAVFVMTIVYYAQMEQQHKISKYLILANYLVLCILFFYGIFRVLHKI